MAKRKQPTKAKKIAPKRSKKPTIKKRLSIRKSGGRRFQNEPEAYTEVTYYKIKGRRVQTPRALLTNKRFRNIQRATLIYKFKDLSGETRYTSIFAASLDSETIEKTIQLLKNDYKLQASAFKLEKLMIYRSIEGTIPEKQKRKKHAKTIHRQTKTHTYKTNKKKRKKSVCI